MAAVVRSVAGSIGASGLPSPDFLSAVRCFLPKPYSTAELLGALAAVIAPT